MATGRAPKRGRVHRSLLLADGQANRDELLHRVFDSYCEVGPGRATSLAFTTWASAAGYTAAVVPGVIIARDATECVVAAITTIVPTQVGPRRRRARRAGPSRPAVHTCGWAQVGGEWRCLQDYYAVGEAPETSCGATWKATPEG